MQASTDNSVAPVIECDHASIGFDNRTFIEDLSFLVYPGDFVSIVGENGSGRSTLMKTILGILRPLRGTLSVNIRGGSRGIGFLPQMSDVSRDLPAKVRDVVLTGLLSRKGLWPFFTKKDKQKAADVIERLHLTDLANRPYRELSGGQQQRVMLARTLLSADEVLLLDEPVTGLDAASAAELYETLRTLNREDGLTILMVTHDVGSALANSTKVLMIEGGEAYFGAPEDFAQEGFAPADSAPAE